MPQWSIELNYSYSENYFFLAGGHCEAQSEDAGDGQMMRLEHNSFGDYIESIRDLVALLNLIRTCEFICG